MFPPYLDGFRLQNLLEPRLWSFMGGQACFYASSSGMIVIMKKRQVKSPSDRVIATEWVPANQLLANPDNFRIHGLEQAGLVQDLIDTVGWVRHVLVNRTTGNIIDGHLRVMNALKQDEETKVPVDYVELSSQEEEILLSLLDESSKFAYVDGAKRDELIARVKGGEEFQNIIKSYEAILQKRSQNLLDEVETANEERKKKAAMSGVDAEPDNPLEWMDISLMIRRADKEEMFNVLDKAKQHFAVGTQADALMAILRNWNGRKK